MPDQIILLKTSIDELLTRLDKRGRDNEKGISEDCLEKLNENTLKTLQEKFKSVRIIHLDTEKVPHRAYTRDFLTSLLSREKDILSVL